MTQPTQNQEPLMLLPTELLALLTFLDDVPTKWGMPIKLFLEEVKTKRSIEKQKTETTENKQVNE